MSESDLERRIHALLAQRISVELEDDDSFAVGVPFMYPDGDMCRVYVSTPDGGQSWSVSDCGSSVMRASYADDVDVLSEPYRDGFNSIVRMHGLTVEHGALVKKGATDLSDAVFAVAQASIDVVNLSRRTPASRCPRIGGVRMSNLKPCPFCGGNNVHLERSPAGFPRWIVCIVCQAEGPPIEHDTKLSAEQAEQWVIEAWNRRKAVGE